MKKTITVILLYAASCLLAQNPDTVKSVKVKSSFYMRSMPIGLYTGAGFMKDKMVQNIEAGVSYGVIDAGIAYGRIAFRPDTCNFVEGRITMDASQYSIFSNEFSLGVGRIFNSNIPLMLEISYTIFAQVGKNWGAGLNTGFYDYSGDTHDVNKTYIGLFFRYGLLRDVNGILNRKGAIRMHHAGR